jgi:hypothetical protein
VDHLEQLELRRILPLLGERAFILTTKILGDPRLALQKKVEWIEGLRRAGGVGPLLELLTGPQLETALADACVVALVQLSGTDEFRTQVAAWTQPVRDEATEAAFARWDWPFTPPSSDPAQRLLVHLALRLAQMSSSPLLDDARAFHQADPRLLYLASGLCTERKRPPLPLLPQSDPITPLQGRSPDPYIFRDPSIFQVVSEAYSSVVRAIWRRAGNPSWVQWIQMEVRYKDVPIPLAASMGLMGLLMGWALLSTVSMTFGGPELGMQSPISLIVIVTLPFVSVCFRAVGVFSNVDGELSRLVAYLLVGALVPILASYFLLLGSPTFSSPALKRWAVRLLTLGWFALAILGALRASENLAIQVFFAATVAFQAAISSAGFGPAWHPFFGNLQTASLCRYLTEPQKPAPQTQATRAKP